ncbi:MAG: hypothetical protein IKW45_06555 [Clostridia bacterium]|nr:hypothetical protein [Clostridia bacterium]
MDKEKVRFKKSCKNCQYIKDLKEQIAELEIQQGLYAPIVRRSGGFVEADLCTLGVNAFPKKMPDNAEYRLYKRDLIVEVMKLITLSGVEDYIESAYITISVMPDIVKNGYRVILTERAKHPLG